jgi:hypothetical protein
MRADITSAINKAPAGIQQQLEHGCGGCLELLDKHLPSDEPVEWIISAAASPHRTPVVINCLLALTDQRLLFVAPAPQALSWRLPSITHIQTMGNVFFVEGSGGGKVQLGAEAAWSPTFASHVEAAIAQAVLAGR